MCDKHNDFSFTTSRSLTYHRRTVTIDGGSGAAQSYSYPININTNGCATVPQFNSNLGNCSHGAGCSHNDGCSTPAPAYYRGCGNNYNRCGFGGNSFGDWFGDMFGGNPFGGMFGGNPFVDGGGMFGGGGFGDMRSMFFKFLMFLGLQDMF